MGGLTICFVGFVGNGSGCPGGNIVPDPAPATSTLSPVLMLNRTSGFMVAFAGPISANEIVDVTTVDPASKYAHPNDWR
jgi:hypothetical protein